MAQVSFAKDIVPIFHQFRAPMLWRLDLTKYEDVKANAAMIYTMISPSPGNPPQMPPAPFPPLTDEQVGLFKKWMDQKYPH